MQVGRVWINGWFIIAVLFVVAVWVWTAVGVKAVVHQLNKPSPVVRMR